MLSVACGVEHTIALCKDGVRLSVVVFQYLCLLVTPSLLDLLDDYGYNYIR